MHNKIRTAILNTMEEWELSVKGKISMDNDFFSTFMAIEVFKELQQIKRPTREKKQQQIVVNLGGTEE